eukprot:2032170-Rhodomonas_salina.1
MSVSAAWARASGSQMPWRRRKLLRGVLLCDLLCMRAVGVPARTASLTHLWVVAVLCPGMSSCEGINASEFSGVGGGLEDGYQCGTST